MSLSSMVGAKEQKLAMRDALALFNIVKVFQEKCRKKETAIPTRIKQLPSEISSFGLVPALTFHFSKIENDAIVRNLAKLLEVNQQNTHDDNPEKTVEATKVFVESIGNSERTSLCKEIASKGGGHATVTLLVVNLLKKDYNLLQTSAPLDSTHSLALHIKELIESPKTLMATHKVLGYLIVLKQLVSGIIGDEGGQVE